MRHHRHRTRDDGRRRVGDVRRVLVARDARLDRHVGRAGAVTRCVEQVAVVRGRGSPVCPALDILRRPGQVGEGVVGVRGETP